MIDLSQIKCLHFIPAIRLDFFYFYKTNQLKADVIVFDLEDSVANDSKKQARENIKDIFSKNLNFLSGYKTCIRPNVKNTEFFKEDMLLIKQLKPDIVLLPKVSNSSEIRFYKRKFANFNLICAIETIEGIENIDNICKKLDSQNDAVVVGYEDLSSELGIERPQDLRKQNPLTQLIFSVFTKARKFNIPIIDAVCRFFKDEDIDILKQECEFTSSLRFLAKFSIHPNQIAIINQHFSKEGLNEYAEKVISKFSEETDGTVVRVMENQMIDAPSLRLYDKIRRHKK